MAGEPAACPNIPPCRHSAFFHEVDVAGEVVCTATDLVPDDRRQRYIQARCPCGSADAR